MVGICGGGSRIARPVVARLLPVPWWLSAAVARLLTARMRALRGVDGGATVLSPDAAGKLSAADSWAHRLAPCQHTVRGGGAGGQRWAGRGPTPFGHLLLRRQRRRLAVTGMCRTARPARHPPQG